jgi:N,N-dimethylformamidase beta subunit-like, C-terminal
MRSGARSEPSRHRWYKLGATLAAAFCVVAVVTLIHATAARTACGNPVACENALPGDAPSDWQVSGVGDSTLQGYATSMSVDVGQTESFKVDDTSAAAYHIDILRLGYYGGDGARVWASDIPATATVQPSCSDDASTGEIDCGNWSVSASWAVPSDAVSGVYIAHLVPNGCTGTCGSQIPFVVRDDASHSGILLSTSDATWEAYNDYGGNSLYSCNTGCSTTSPPGGKPQPAGYTGAYAVSYNRPFDGGFNTDGGASYLWYAEYQLIRFLERNGYDVSYVSSSDVDRDGSLLLNHNVFISSAHDEYWSAGQRDNVTAARNAGVNLAFFSGNEVFWKTRWADNYRTMITYKETHFLDAPGYPQSQRPDPDDPPTWTGAWADPRGAQLPGEDGGQPQNSLTGQLFIVNAGTSAIQVPYQYAKLRMWRNTSIARLGPGQSDTLGDDTLGYEWDINDTDAAQTPLGIEAGEFRPPGEIELSSTTVSPSTVSNMQVFSDYGTNVTTGPAETHHLTLYRYPSGALVFGAGTVQWSWGLDNTNAWGDAGPPGDSVDLDMQQATVNLLADMGAQPATLMAGLFAASQSTDTTPPASTITSNSGGTITGTATDSGGGVIAGVEVSTDGSSTWHPATLTTPDGPTVDWTYSGSGPAEARATNDSGYTEGFSYPAPVQGGGGGTGGGSGGGGTGGGGTGGGGTSEGPGGSTSAPHPGSHPLNYTSTGSSGHDGLAKAAKLSGRTLTETSRGRITMSITNPNSVAVRVTATLTSVLPHGHEADEDGVTIGTAHFTLRRRATVNLTIRLSKQAVAYLKRHRYLEAGVAIILSANGRGSRASTATVVIWAPGDTPITRRR